MGCATSFLTYLVEYFPAHMTLRLEVNHPLYALAWWGAGELLFRVTRLMAGGQPALRPREAGGWLGGVLAVGLLPAVMLTTKHDSFIVADHFVWQLHIHYIAEFLSLAAIPFSFGAVINCLPLILFVPVLYFIGQPTIPRGWKAQLVLALGPAVLFSAMAAQQVRWWGMFDGILFALLAVLFALLDRLPARRLATGFWFVGCALVFLPGALAAAHAIRHSADLTDDDVQALAERDLAHWLRLRMGRDPAVVLSSPVTATRLIYDGGLSGLGTLYWENRDGLEHTAEIFAATSLDQAHELARRYGVTHIVLLSWSQFAENYVRLYRGLTPGQPLPENVFISGLLHGGRLPPWLRPVPYRLPEIAALKGQTVLVYEVVPDQSPGAFAVHLANYLVEMERLEDATRLAPALEHYPESLPALTMLAYLQGKSGNADRFSTTLQRIIAILPQAHDLELEDRIRLAFVLAAGERLELAEEQVRQCLTELDDRRLRRLTSGTLRDFLALTEKLGMKIADPQLRALALELLPPVMRG